MKNFYKIFCMIVLLCAFASKSNAQGGIYMKIASVTGDVTVPAAYAGTTLISSYQSGAGRTAKITVGGKGEVTTTAPSLSEISITLPLGSTSLPLLNSLLNTATATNSVDFYFLSASCSCPYYRVHLENVYVTGYSESSGGDTPSVSVSLFYTKIAWAFYKANSTTITNTTGYDLTTGKSFTYSFP